MTAPTPDPSSLAPGAGHQFRCERALWVLRDADGNTWLAPGVTAPDGQPGGVMPDIAPGGTYGKQETSLTSSRQREWGDEDADTGGVMPDVVLGETQAGQETSPTGPRRRRPRDAPPQTGTPEPTILLVPAEGSWHERPVRLYRVDEALLPSLSGPPNADVPTPSGQG